MIKRLQLLLAGFLTLCFLGVSGSAAMAADFNLIPACKDHDNATICPENNSGQSQQDNRIYGPNGIITKIANLLSVVAGIAAVLVLIVAGIQYMVSTGDATKVNNAKNAILYAIVGLVVIVVARTIVVFIVSKL